MSWWTYIIGSIHVDTLEERHDMKEYVEGLLEKAPPITGSEGDADVFVNVLSGHSDTIMCDCLRCPFFGGYNSDDDEICRKPKFAHCPEPETEYQSRVVITVVGDLRDRYKPQTKAEWRAFRKFVEHSIGKGRGCIMKSTCKISD